MAARAKLSGISALRRTLRRAGADMGDLKRANAEVAQFGARVGRRFAPRRTGALAHSGKGNRAAGSAVITFGKKSVPYAPPIHWGWEARNIEAQPFVWDPMHKLRPVWGQIYQRELQRILDNVRGT